MQKLTAICFLIIFTTFSAFAQITKIPFEMYGDHMIIKVSIDDSKPLDFIFDTGSGLTVLDIDLAQDMKLVGKSQVNQDSRTSMELIKHNKIAVNGFLMEQNIKIFATDLDRLEISLGRNLDGILGYDLMHHHTLYIDYDNLEMSIYEHGQGPTSGDMIPFYLNTGIPTIGASVILNNNEPLDGTFFVMSGAATTLDFNAPFADKHQIIDKTGKHFSYLVKDISKNETPHYEGHIQQLKFGKEIIENLPIGISQAKSGVQSHGDVSGIIGSGILRQFNVTIDVPGKRFFFTPNTAYGKAMKVNSSGIDIQLSPDKTKVMIHKVFDESPAKEAGIKENDELISINGKTMNQITFPEIKELLKDAGSEVELVIKSGDKNKNISLKLRSLID